MSRKQGIVANIEHQGDIHNITPSKWIIKEVDQSMQNIGFFADKQEDLYYCEHGAILEPINLQPGQSLKQYLRENKEKISKYAKKGYQLSIARGMIRSIFISQDGIDHLMYSNYTLCCANYENFLKMDEETKAKLRDG